MWEEDHRIRPYSRGLYQPLCPQSKSDRGTPQEGLPYRKKTSAASPRQDAAAPFSRRKMGPTNQQETTQAVLCRKGLTCVSPSVVACGSTTARPPPSLTYHDGFHKKHHGDETHEGHHRRDHMNHCSERAQKVGATGFEPATSCTPCDYRKPRKPGKTP